MKILPSGYEYKNGEWILFYNVDAIGSRNVSIFKVTRTDATYVHGHQYFLLRTWRMSSVPYSSDPSSHLRVSEASYVENPMISRNAYYGLDEGDVFLLTEDEVLMHLDLFNDTKTRSFSGRRLKANWTIQLEEDLCNFHGINIEDELTGILSHEIK